MIPNLISTMGRKGFRANLARKGVPVILKWATRTGGTLDPTTGATVDAVVTEQSETIQAFKQDDVAKTMIHHFGTYQEGDMILDILPDVTIESRAELTFTLDGVEYSQKEVGAEGGGPVVPQFEMQAGTKIYRTIYLKRQA